MSITNGKIIFNYETGIPAFIIERKKTIVVKDDYEKNQG